MTSTHDQLNGWGPDHDHRLSLAARLASHTITDLGCGTGQLTVALARHRQQELIAVSEQLAALAPSSGRAG